MTVVPVWPVLMEQYKGSRSENPFRQEQNFADKIVVMYSGNQGIANPLDTLLETAKVLRGDERFLFVFIGQGTQKEKVTYYRESLQCKNIVQLPYQPKNKIHISLSSADYQVVSMGNDFVGFTHPNKIYGAMYAGRKILYIGPERSFISRILKDCPGNLSVRHGQSKLLSEKLCDEANDINKVLEQGKNNLNYAQKHFDPSYLKQRMYDALLD